ncbi:hypothetical protein KI387_039858, partial [Taxus chinensis]
MLWEVTPRVLNGSQDWIKLEKDRHSAQLDQKHWQKLDAFSRQIRVKDDRMEALTWHMITMERETQRLQSEIEILNHNLKQTKDEKTTLEALLVEKDHDLELLKERLDLHENKPCDKIHFDNLQLRPFEMDAEAMQLELKAVTSKLREREREHRAILIKVLEEVENELQDKDYKLAVTEAKLIQEQIHYEQERKSKENIISEIMKKKNGSRDCSVDHVVEYLESCPKSTTGAACLEVEKLSEMIAEARDRMAHRKNQHKKQLNDLVEQAVKVSKTGCQLRTMKNLLQTAEEKIENSVECSMSQNFQELDLSVRDSCFHKKEHGLDKHVSEALHRIDSPEICNLGNVMKHQAEYIIMPGKLQEELWVSGDCQNGTKMNSINSGNDVCMLRLDTRSNGPSKGKSITSDRCSTLKKMEQSRDECYSEGKTRRQASEKTLPLTQSVSETKLHRNSNAAVDKLASLNVLNRCSSWKKDVQAVAVFSKVKELEQQLEQLEKISKPDISKLPNIKDRSIIIQAKNSNEDWQVQLTWAPISAIHLLKKQVKRYQSLIEKIDDLCKRMHNNDPLGTVNSSLNARTREQTAAKELFLLETFQLQRYVVATGQKLMTIQREISHYLSTTNNELGFPAIVNILESIENAK